MARKSPSGPVIVAELGRPEAPSETAARKAKSSRLYRERKTVNNLVFSLLVSLAMVLLIVLVVPRGVDTWSEHGVDVAQFAEETAPTAGQPLLAPEVPSDWKAKQAELRAASSGDISYWYIGYTTPENGYATVQQAFTTTGTLVDESWIGQQLEAQAPTGTETLGGLEWTVYDHPERNPDHSNMQFGLETQLGATTLLVYGTDSADALRSLAATVAKQATSLGLGETNEQEEAL